MVKLNQVVKLLDRELKPKSIKDKYSNGLQVRGSNDVTKVGLATDACMFVFQKAKKLGCDLIITHHGLFSKSDNRYEKQANKLKAAFLKKSRISLYCCHLPLDKNAKYGNNVVLLRILGLSTKERFAFSEVGYIGHLPKPISAGEIADVLRRNLKTGCKIYNPKSKVRSVAICSGYGGGEIYEAIERKADLLVTGELSHSSLVKIRDSGLSVIAAGHYATETVGVREVGKLLEKKFNLKMVFIDAPTGM